MMAISCLEVAPVHPIDYVERAVRYHEENANLHQFIHLAVPLQHDELWHYRD
jgi:hypothetical protein